MKNNMTMKSPLFIVKNALIQTIEKVFGAKEDNVPILPFQKSCEWDYQSAFANKLHAQLKKTNPEFISKFPTPSLMAKAASETLKSDFSDLIDKVSVSEQGFLLMTLNSNFLLEGIQNLLNFGPFIERSEVPQVIVVDFSSPNIAKEMHVGHLRSTIIGESICRFFEFQGNTVHRVNHLGDWGTQFGMLIAHLIESYPSFIEEMPNLKDLETFYKQSKIRFDSDSEFKKRAQGLVVKLQSGDELCQKAWKVLCDISQQFYNQIYKRFDIKLDNFGESFYNSMIPVVLNELKEKELIKEDQGAQCIFIPGKKNPLIVVKSDGGYNYDSTDIAALNYRIKTLKANRIVIITDVGQYPHFELIFAAGKLAGWTQPTNVKLEHMGFGVILGENGERMKTRGGETVKLMDLLKM